MNGWTVAAFLVGWLLGVWMSHRKIRATNRHTLKTLTEIVTQVRELRITLDDAQVEDLATEEGRKRILDTIAGKAKH